MQIELAKLSDAEQILNLQKLAFKSEAELHNNFNIPPLLQTLESIKSDFQEFQFFKGCKNGQLIGAVKIRRLNNNWLSIGRLVIHPNYQGHGFGKQMMTFIENRFSDVAGYELFTAEKSTRNIAFYGKLGYHVSSKINEPGHDDISLVVLSKAVNV